MHNLGVKIWVVGTVVNNAICHILNCILFGNCIRVSTIDLHMAVLMGEGEENSGN
jgi:hypothetical protein